MVEFNLEPSSVVTDLGSFTKILAGEPSHACKAFGYCESNCSWLHHLGSNLPVGVHSPETKVTDLVQM